MDFHNAVTSSVNNAVLGLPLGLSLFRILGFHLSTAYKIPASVPVSIRWIISEYETTQTWRRAQGCRISNWIRDVKRLYAGLRRLNDDIFDLWIIVWWTTLLAVNISSSYTAGLTGSLIIQPAYSFVSSFVRSSVRSFNQTPYTITKLMRFPTNKQMMNLLENGD